MPDQPAVPSFPWPFRGRSPVLKVIAILALVVAFIVPLAMIHGAIGEREGRRLGVVNEIGESWGRAQRVFGPVLVIPYREARSEAAIAANHQPVEREIYLLPDRYAIAARIDPEVRRRGLFETVVYRSTLDISGNFIVPDPSEWAPKGAEILWDAARLLIDVRDRRSLDAGLAVRWSDGRMLAFAPSRRESGLSAATPLSAASVGQAQDFALTVALKGSEALTFLPLGRDTQVAASSPWRDPSFIGQHLPDVRDVSESGFSATWTVSYFARDFAQVLGPGDPRTFTPGFDRSEFGVRLISAVTAYQQAERAVKYGLLIIVGTFTTFFLFEIIRGLRIHIFQYGLVGLSLCVFYLLLVSLSEQVGFGPAYLAASVVVVGQILLYCHRAVGGWRGTFLLGGLLAVTYAALYQLMLLEDLALLIGSIGLFAALSAIMLVTRRIDWYALSAGGPSAVPAAGSASESS
jgi:inner membrane protein